LDVAGLPPTNLTQFRSADLAELLLAGNDTLLGNSEEDALFGGGGADIINGGASGDLLDGGFGKDLLTGGLGTDIFDFNATVDTKKGAARDIIVDFTHEDKIELAQIDANTKKGGVQHFKFIGKQDFHHKAGHYRVRLASKSQT
jgi:serralysin